MGILQQKADRLTLRQQIDAAADRCDCSVGCYYFKRSASSSARALDVAAVLTAAGSAQLLVAWGSRSFLRLRVVGTATGVRRLCRAATQRPADHEQPSGVPPGNQVASSAAAAQRSAATFFSSRTARYDDDAIFEHSHVSRLAGEAGGCISIDVTPRGVGVFGWGAVCCASDE